MSEEKKVLLFIVEGISDEVSFEGVLENFFENYAVKVAVMRCDITVQNSPAPSEIKAILSNKINEFCQKERIQFPQDFIQIVHLVDTDGAFVNDTAIISGADASDGIKYTENNIIAKNVQEIKKRNAVKKAILKKISSMGKLNHIEYKVYYVSRNLEHVLHNRIDNVTDAEKETLSEAFDDKYGEKENLDAFLAFINDKIFAVQQDYKQSWQFIQQDFNSLKRYTNLNLLFKREITD